MVEILKSSGINKITHSKFSCFDIIVQQKYGRS